MQLPLRCSPPYRLRAYPPARSVATTHHINGSQPRSLRVDPLPPITTAKRRQSLATDQAEGQAFPPRILSQRNSALCPRNVSRDWRCG